MLFDKIIYGPIHSRRLGVSLGINLMPVDHKLCSFNCVYCECGFNSPCTLPKMPSCEAVVNELEQVLRTMVTPPDVLTFSGNGEPTLHPDFLQIVKGTRLLRDRYCPQAKISVLSNSTQLFRDDVREALQLVDYRILKIDSAVDATMRLIDQPVNSALSVAVLTSYLDQWKGDFILQTCFLRGEYLGRVIDNTTPRELNAWYDLVRRLKPKQVMIYVIDRTTPVATLTKLTREEMEKIAAPLIQEGFNIQITA